MALTGPQVIVLATPVFLALIALEFAVGRWRGRDTYRLADALASIGLGIMSQITGLFVTLFTLGIYTFVHERWALWRLPADSPWVWLGALIAYDFCYYWHHRAGHRIALFWASHAVHHQSEDYNLSTALRQTSGGWPAGWIFYLPMALAGVPPLVFAVVALIDLLYQYWVHTQQIGRLGWFDRWFCAPSNHRVHHAVNDRYLDRNYGGILIVWDRLFGSYAAEDETEPCVYGTRTPLRSWNPLWANLQVYAELAKDSWRAAAWADKLRVWLKPPGWRPADVAARWPKPAFDIAAVTRYDPPLSRAAALAATLLFVLLLAATAALLWQAHLLGAGVLAAGDLDAVTSFGLVGHRAGVGRGAVLRRAVERAGQRGEIAERQRACGVEDCLSGVRERHGLLALRGLLRLAGFHALLALLFRSSFLLGALGELLVLLGLALRLVRFAELLALFAGFLARLVGLSLLGLDRVEALLRFGISLAGRCSLRALLRLGDQRFDGGGGRLLGSCGRRRVFRVFVVGHVSHSSVLGL